MPFGHGMRMASDGLPEPHSEERAVSWQQQEVSDPVSETGPMWNAALDDNAVLRDGIRVPQNFELPLEGSTGFAGAAVMLLYERPDGTSTVLRRLAAGDMFYIRQESGAYWQVCLLDGTVGWLENELCMINLRCSAFHRIRKPQCQGIDL